MRHTPMSTRRRSTIYAAVLTCLTILLASTARLHAQPIQLIKDLYNGPASMGSTVVPPRAAAQGNNCVWFTYEDLNHGPELWRSDGTTEGTHLVIELSPTREYPPGVGGGEHAITNLTPAANKLFFDAHVGPNRWLMVTDGTPTGTIPLRQQPVLTLPYSSHLDDTAVLGSKVIFKGYNSLEENELYVTDGTPEGTGLLLDLLPGSGSSEPGEFVALGNHVYFTAKTSGIQRQLWRTDGTPAGTQVVEVNHTNMSRLRVANNRLFYTLTQSTTPWPGNPLTGSYLVSYDPQLGTVTFIQGGVGNVSEFMPTSTRLYYSDSDVSSNLLATDGVTSLVITGSLPYAPISKAPTVPLPPSFIADGETLYYE